MRKMTIELTNGRLLFLEKVKGYDLRCTAGGSEAVFEIEKEGKDGSTVLINWDHVIFATYKEDKEDAEIH